jgi:hypothetical protein
MDHIDIPEGNNWIQAMLIPKELTAVSQANNAYVFREKQSTLLGLLITEGEGCTVFRNVSIYLPVDTTSHLRRLESFAAPLW